MRATKIAFVALFFGLLSLPVIQLVMPIFNTPEMDEKRQLAPAPDFVAKIIRGDGRLAAGINRWFDDRYGFRSYLIRTKNQLDFWLFNYSEKIFIGRDGWLYQPGFFAGKVKTEREGEIGARLVHERYLELARYLSSRSIKLIIISNPSKGTIYPQYLPPNVPRLPENDRFQQLRSFLKGRSEWIYIDGQDLLERQCGDFQLFHKQDIHMMFPGGLCFARELVARVAKAEGLPTSPWDHEFKLSPIVSSAGGQAEFMSLLFPLSAPAYAINPLYGTDTPLGGYFADDSSHVFEWAYHAGNSFHGSKLPTLVLFGNSFLDHYLSAGFFSYFSDVYRARDNGKNFATVLRTLPVGTRYFVFQFLEPWTNEISRYEIPDDWNKEQL